ncbi:hypothetical protein ES703_52198 [subsurface metagenome]
MAKKLGSSIRQVLLFGVIAGWIPLAYLCSCSPSPTGTALPNDNVSAQFDETNPLGANAACYVCHMTFVKEELSKTHLRAEITCVHCHGLSAGHANDEDIGATPPDISFKRDQVNVMCLKCHEDDDLPSEEVVAGEHPSVCTDCHGTHKINQTKGVKL